MYKRQQEQGEAVNVLKQKIVEVNDRQRTAEQKTTMTEKEKDVIIEELKGHINHIKSGQERLQRQLAEAEIGPSTRVNGNNNCELKYNGTDRFPIEFLKELSELQHMYYPTDNVKWIGKHLEADAAIWWRVVRCLLYTSRCV